MVIVGCCLTHRSKLFSLRVILADVTLCDVPAALLCSVH